MPRLLLVDDNPSIHRIAESLLAPTDVELVCVDSAAEALDRIGRGERFDVALVDMAMPGMDGWTLLSRLRDLEATARMPIALMAGVLDPVDPAKLAKAPIQGFLKKPIELRELGDRVKALLITPVPEAASSPFSTVPSTPARDLLMRAEAALPELRPTFDDTFPDPMGGELELPEPEADLLVLTAEDLWPEAPAAAVAEPAAPPSAAADVQLELEELDLDSLQDLAAGSPPPEAPVAEAFPTPAPEAAAQDEPVVTLSGLEELDILSADFPMPAPAAEAAKDAPEDDFSFADLPSAAALVGAAAAMGAVAPTHPALAESVLEAEVPAPAAGGQAPDAPGHDTPAPAGPTLMPSGLAPAPSEPTSVSAEQARALVQALLADPVLVDALVKAVVARMGDQVLREIAWEVMPDLAGRLQR